MVKALAKQVFGASGAEVESMGKVDAIHAAGFAFNAKLRDLERQFDATVRAEYLAEITAIQAG